MNKTVTFDLPNGDSITLPIQGAQYLYYDLGPGVPDRVEAAMHVIGLGQIGTNYATTSRQLTSLIEQIDALNQASGQEAGIFPEDCPEAAELRPALEALQDGARREWAPIQAVIDAAKRAVEDTGYDGAPC